MDGVAIGQYRVTGTIGRGGMGAVYAAQHALLGRSAAIKVLLPELSQKQDVVMRFFNEARAATAIRHPGIVEIYDFGWTDDGAAFIVMEHLEGETLGRRAARTRFHWPAALAIARQIAGALSAAHAKGIVHRDLKPDNVFLVPDPEVPGGERIKLLDFGIAKLAGDSSNTVSVTRTGAVLGTPTYMAPEQCRGVAIDHRADLYALGCVIYELCCGRPPFLGEGTGDVLAAHIHVPVPAMAGAVSEIPPVVERLVRRLLAKLPGDRVQNADEVIRAIDAVTSDRSAAATGPGRAVPIATSPSLTTLSGSASTSLLIPRASRRGRWSLAVFSVAMAAIAATVVALIMRGGGAGEPVVAASSAPPAVAPVATEPRTVARNAELPPGDTPSAPAPRASEPVVATSAAPSPVAPAASPSPVAPDPAPVAPKEDPPSAETPSPPPPLERATVEIDVDSAPPGAQVVLDGAVLGTTPFHGALPRRDRDARLVIRLAGHVERAVVVHPTRPITEHVKLVRIAPPAQRSKTSRDQSVNPF